jgi:hypothetical protein
MSCLLHQFAPQFSADTSPERFRTRIELLARAPQNADAPRDVRR